MGRLLGPLIKTGLHLIGDVLTPLTKSVLIPLGLTAAPTATYAATHKEKFRSGTTKSITLNEEIFDIIEIIKYLEESGLLIKLLSKRIKKKQTSKKEVFSECY